MKRPTVALATALLWIACSDASGPGSEPGVSLSFSTGSSTAAPTSGFFASVMADTMTDGQNELIIDRAEVVLREIELERVETEDCDSSVHNDDCEEFEVGPVLVDLPLNGQTETHVTVNAPPGSYDEIEFEIHKVSNDDPEDADFRALHPDMVGQSIRVTGTFNGESFTYETDLDVEQEHDLNPPLVIDESGSVNVTVLIDVSMWFVDGSGNLVDPQTANKGGDNEGLVKENIKQSVEAFEDDDHDGDDDNEDDS